MIQYALPFYFALSLFPCFSRIGLSEQFGKFGLLILIFLLLFLKSSKAHYLRFSSRIALLYIISILGLSCFHVIMYGFPQNPVRLISWLSVFFIMSSFSFKNETKVFSVSIKIVVLLIDFILLYFCLVHSNLYFYRSDVAAVGIDKPTITFYFTLYCSIVYTEYIHNACKKIDYFLFPLTIFINIYIAQSKLALTSILIFIFVYHVINQSQEYKIRVKTILKIVIPCAIILFIWDPTFFFLPDEFKIMANHYLGTDVFNTSTTLKDTNTYSIRQAIRAHCFNLFFKNPILGVGIGNYRNYAGSDVTFNIGNGAYVTITEAESQFLGILVEGGLWYIISFASLLVFICVQATMTLRKKINSFESSICLAIIIPLIYLCFGNDFFNVNFWIIIGYCLSLIGFNKKDCQNDSNKKRLTFILKNR